MKLEIESWDSKNLRSPDMFVPIREYKGSSKPKVTLLQMPNGVGKTTTKNLLQAALNGEAEKWTADQVNELQDSSHEGTKGEFTLTLRVDGKKLVFHIDFDFLHGSASYKTTYVSEGKRDGHHPPAELKDVFRPDVVKLFFFDGETAQDLTDTATSGAEDAIDGLCQLYLLDKFITTAETNFKVRSNQGESKAKQKQGYTRARNNFRNLETLVAGIKNERHRITAASEANKKTLSKLKKIVDSFAEESDQIKRKVQNSQPAGPNKKTQGILIPKTC